MSNIRIKFFQPYGSADNASLVSKLSPQVPAPIPAPPKTPRKVARLNEKKS